MPKLLVINGWTLYFHPLFLKQVRVLEQQVNSLACKDPANYKNKNATKRLAAIHQLVFEKIPADPTRSEYRQGNTLGNEHKHWFRAKFFQQYRLFFRYNCSGKLIIYAWVNDANTKRAYDSKSDAYKIFKKMLEEGQPPNDWNELLNSSELLPDKYSIIF